ncbi:MAG: CAAD domain-containing protein [Cyanobacteria bacterium J06639_18]
MEDLSQQPETADTAAQEDTSIVEASGTSDLVTQSVDSSSEPKSDSKRQFIAKNLVDFLGEIPTRIGETYKKFQTPIVSIVLIVTVAILVKILVAVFSALNEIPLVEPILELIGGCYVVWFAFRYLLKGSTREELRLQINTLVEQFLNKKTKSS